MSPLTRRQFLKLSAVTAGTLAGQGARVRRVTRSLEGDSSAAREALGWEARKPFSAALDDLMREPAGGP